jgi:autotransporter-associated beta strand protein
VNNTYISNGVVKLGSATAIPSGGATTGWLVLDGGATFAGKLDMNGFDQTVNALSGLTGTFLGQIVNDGGTGTNTLTINETAATTFNGDILDKTGVTGGKVALVKNGANTLTLTSGGTGSSFSGGTTINDGIVSGGTSTTANSTMLGTGPVIFGTNGTLQLAGWAGSTTPGYNSMPNPLVILSNYTATILGCCRVGGPFPSSVTGGTNSTLIYISRYVRGQMGGNWNGFQGTLMASNNAASGGVSFPVNTASGFPNARVVLAPNEGMMNFVAGTPTIPIGELTGDSSTSISLNSDNSGGQPVRWAVGGLNTTAQFDGSISGTPGIIKVGTGIWTLTSGTLSYSGLTTVSNGVLALGASANLTASTPITIASPGILDVSASGTLTLAAQTIQGNGTLNGSLSAGVGSTVSPGGANNIATLIVTNAVTLDGTTLMELNRTNSPATNDMLVAASVAVSGTLQVNNLGADLHTGDTFKLFSVPITGAFAVTNLPVTTGDGFITYVWTNKLDIDGTIQVLVGTPNVNLNPTNITAAVSGNVLTLAWPSDYTGWHLQIQTNSLSAGLGNNWVTLPGSDAVNTVNFTIDPANGAVFYRMVYP